MGGHSGTFCRLKVLKCRYIEKLYQLSYSYCTKRSKSGGKTRKMHRLKSNSNQRVLKHKQGRIQNRYRQNQKEKKNTGRKAKPKEQKRLLMKPKTNVSKAKSKTKEVQKKEQQENERES